MMAVVGAVIGALTAGRAEAKRKLDFLDEDPPAHCPRGRSWPAVTACLAKAFRAKAAAVEVAFERDGLRVASVPDGDGKLLVMYVQTDAKGWRRGPLEVRTGRFHDVLRMEMMTTPTGEALRVDMGASSRTGFVIVPGSSVRGVLRRTTTYVCRPEMASCQTLMTSCETFVDGRAYWTFHGEPVWHPTLGLRMRGDLGKTGGVCKPSASQLVGDE